MDFLFFEFQLFDILNPVMPYIDPLLAKIASQYLSLFFQETGHLCYGISNKSIISYLNNINAFSMSKEIVYRDIFIAQISQLAINDLYRG